jgi:hypothetical protein
MKKPSQIPPKSAIDALVKCNEYLYPNIFILLKIFSTLPITTSARDRQFSTLWQIKTYLKRNCRRPNDWTDHSQYAQRDWNHYKRETLKKTLWFKLGELWHILHIYAVKKVWWLYWRQDFHNKVLKSDINYIQLQGQLPQPNNNSGASTPCNTFS